MRPNWLNVPLHTPPNWLKPTQMHWQQHSSYRKLKMRLRNGQRKGWLMLGLMLLVVLLLSGCCTMQPIPPSVQPTIPTPPVSQLSPPAQTYSSNAAVDIETWRLKLISGSAKQ